MRCWLSHESFQRIADHYEQALTSEEVMVEKIAMTPCTSSNIIGFGYDLTRHTLAIEFKSGDIWHYPGVPYDLAEQFSEAESKGKFYVANIKGKFEAAAKMTGKCPACNDKGWIGEACKDCGSQRYVREERPVHA